MARNKRLSITLSDHHYELLEIYARSRGEAPTSTATDFIKIRLEQLSPEIKKLEIEAKVNLNDLLDCLVGDRNIEDLDLKAIAKAAGKPLELIEAIAAQHQALRDTPCYLSEEECKCES